MDLTDLFAHTLGVPARSPIPTSPSSPVPGAFFANPVRPSGIPPINPNMSALPPGGLNVPGAGGAPTPDMLGPSGDGGSGGDLGSQLGDMLGGDQATMQAGAGGGLGSIFADAAGGMGEDHSKSPPLSAFAAGFSGAMAAASKRRTDAETAANDAEDRKFKREDRSWERQKDLWNRDRTDSKDTRDANKDARDAEASKYDMVNKVLDIQKKQTDLDHPNLDPKDRLAIEQETGRRLKAFNENHGEMTLEELQTNGAAIRKDVEDYVLHGSKAAAGTPAAAGAAAAPAATAAPQGPSDGKSQGSAYAVPSGISPRDYISKLPKGAWVIDPRSGEPRQKQ